MEITPEIIKKVVDATYTETYPGLIRDMKFVTRRTATGRLSIDVHILLNDEVYRSTMTGDGGGFFTVMEMEEKLQSVLKYLSPMSVDFFRYMDNSEEDMQQWNQLDDEWI